MNVLVNVISGAGYVGIAFLMMLASCAIPLPSEIVMAFSGFLAGEGRFSLPGVIIAGSIGSFLGSVLLYFIGHRGGRQMFVKYGKFLLLSEIDLERTERFFAKYGNTANLFGRLVPVIRTFISFPAGLAKMEIKKFLGHAALGSVLWASALAFAGEMLGSHWSELNNAFHNLNILIGIILLIWVGHAVHRHMLQLRNKPISKD